MSRFYDYKKWLFEMSCLYSMKMYTEFQTHIKLGRSIESYSPNIRKFIFIDIINNGLDVFDIINILAYNYVTISNDDDVEEIAINILVEDLHSMLCNFEIKVV